MEVVKNSTQSSVSEFTDYRDFLKKRFYALKATAPQFSYRYLASKTGVSDSYFKHVFEKRRNLSIDHLAKISRVFQLTDYETKYLLLLIIRQSTVEKEIHDQVDALIRAIPAAESLANL